MTMSIAAAVPARDQLVDRGVDRRVLAADAESGQEPEQEEPPRREGQRGQRRREQVDAQGDHEQLLAAEPVGEPAEEQRAHAGPSDIDRGAEAGDLGLGDVQPAARLADLPGDVADDGDFQAVEDPDGAEADHDHPVPPRPRQPVQARRDLRGDRPGLNVSSCGFALPGGRRAKLRGGAARPGARSRPSVHRRGRRAPVPPARVHGEQPARGRAGGATSSARGRRASPAGTGSHHGSRENSRRTAPAAGPAGPRISSAGAGWPAAASGSHRRAAGPSRCWAGRRAG